MKILVEIGVRHAHTPADDWEPWVIEVEATSRKKVTSSLEAITDFFTEHCIGEAWSVGEARVLSAKESRGRPVENRLVLTDEGISEVG
jgi:hypothetical protein